VLGKRSTEVGDFWGIVLEGNVQGNVLDPFLSHVFVCQFLDVIFDVLCWSDFSP